MEKDALSVAQDLNQTLYDASVPPIDRSLLISGLLLVLRDPVFINSYRDKKISEKKLLKLLGDSMETELEELKVQDSFKFSMVLTRFKDVFNQPGMLKDNARVLRSVLDTLKAKVYPCMQGDFSLDIIGKFYSEFLRYANITLPYLELMLPANADGTPDFNSMDSYMKSLPYGDRI